MPNAQDRRRRRGGRAQRGAVASRRLQGRVRDMAQGGDAVVITEAGVVLAPGGAPGERVEVSQLARRQGVLRAAQLRVLEPSSDRVEPPCTLAGRCGGCPWMHLRRDAQHALKRAWLAQAIAGAALPGVEVHMEAPEPALGQRRRARLAWQGGTKPRLGYRALHARQLVDVPSCPVLEPSLDQAREVLRQNLLPLLVGQGELSLVRSDAAADSGVIVGVTSPTPQPPAVYAVLEALADRPPIVGTWLRVADLPQAAQWGRHEARFAGAEGGGLEAPAAGFSQAQSAVNQQLVDRVVALAEAEGCSVLELYAGHGNLSVPLAHRAARLWAVEGDAAAAEACRRNLRAAGLAGAHVRQGPVESWADGPPVDVVVLDPPRAGARAVTDAIVRRRPQRIVYVSCAAPTLARDVRAFAEAGYRVDQAIMFDMFPHTAHVEMLVRLRLPGAGVQE